jgi:hypothetical protein
MCHRNMVEWNHHIIYIGAELYVEEAGVDTVPIREKQRKRQLAMQ